MFDWILGTPLQGYSFQACDFSSFYQNSGFPEKKTFKIFIIEIVVEILKFVGWVRKRRKVQMW